MAVSLAVSKRVCKGYFNKTAFEFHDGESAGTIPYMAPEILKRRPYGRSCDWWSAGVTFYKLMTGRVPFRGETKELLRDKIINSPLKWPKVEEHPHSATPEAKDMVFKMLKKNPVERLGSVHYSEIRGHPFFDNFNWKRLATTKELCNIPAIAECMGGVTQKEGQPPPKPASKLTVGATSNTLKRKLQKVEDMIDVEPSTQRPLYTYSAPSFKKMINTARTSKGPVNLKESFFNTSGMESEELDYKKASDMDVNVGISGFSGTAASADKSITAKEKMDLIMFRTKSFGKYWNFGVQIIDVIGEQNKPFIMVEKVTKGSPAEASHVLEGDVIIAVNGQEVSTLPLAEVKKRMNDSGDQLVLTVLSSSAFRLLESRRDMDQILKAAGKDTLQLGVIKTTCGGSGNFGFKAFEAKAWNEQQKALVHCHVIQKVG
ncbi:putative serine/threonine protein kinase [Ixodes scapularis]